MGCTMKHTFDELAGMVVCLVAELRHANGVNGGAAIKRCASVLAAYATAVWLFTFVCFETAE